MTRVAPTECRRWTEAEDAVPRDALAGPGRPPVMALARQLDRTYGAVLNRLQWLRGGRRRSRTGQDGRPRRAAEALERRCLRCGARFETCSRFIRVCDDCKKAPEWRAGA